MEFFFDTSGLSAPVPRGRKGKNRKKELETQQTFEKELAEMDLDPEKILKDNGYKKHLQRHANK